MIGLALVGFALLVGSVIYAFSASSREARTLAAEIRDLKRELKEADAKTQIVEKDRRLLEVQLRSKRAAAVGKLAEVEARESELAAAQAKRAESLEAAREKLGRSRTAAETAAHALAKARREQDLDQRIQALLRKYQDGVVTIATTKGQVGTGFVVRDRTAAQILTFSSAAPYGVKLAVLVKNPSIIAGKDQDKSLVAKASVLYRDRKTGLVLLSCEFEKPSVADRLGGLPMDSLADARKGEMVYSISTQVLGDQVFENCVFDGTISSTSHRHGARQMLRTTIPANPGSLGSPLIDREGRLVGVLVASVRGEERASIALPGAEVLRALDRMRSALGRSADGKFHITYEYPTSDKARIASAGRAHAVPCSEGDSFPLPSAEGCAPMLTPGPNGCLMAWNRGREEIVSIKRGQVKPRWTRKAANVRDILHRPWSKHAAVLKPDDTGRSFMLNVATGVRGRSVPSSFARLQPLAYYEIDPYWVVVMKAGFSFIHTRTGKEYTLDLMAHYVLVGQVGDYVLFFSRKGCLGLFDGRDFANVLRRAEDLIARWAQIRTGRASDALKRRAANTINAQFRVLNDELRREFVFFDARGFDHDLWTSRDDSAHVGSTHKVIICHQVWEIGPKKLAYVGELDPPKHSAGSEEWFFAFLREESVGEKRPFDVSISPDGKHALTETHLFDLTTLQPLVELPFPSTPAGFLSDGKTVYLYDRCNQRVVFMDLKKLLEMGKRPWTFGE